MDPRQINIMVTEAGHCPLLAVGDSFGICGHEVQAQSGKLCLRALNALYVQLPAALRLASPKERGRVDLLVLKHCKALRLHCSRAQERTVGYALSLSLLFPASVFSNASLFCFFASSRRNR